MRLQALIATAVSLVNVAAQVVDPSIIEDVTPQELVDPSFWSQFLEPANETLPLKKRSIIIPGIRNKACKTFPGDLLWPNSLGWNILKLAVGGRLLVGAPGGRVCHNSLNGKPTYNADQCQVALGGFYDPEWHFAQPTEPLWAQWGKGCDPTTNPSDPCVQGAHPHYVIDAKNVQDVQLGVHWARNLNIRLVIRNTGHDFMGKSMGAGSLSIWTHNFKTIQFINNYSGPGGYTGSAVKVGAGVQTRDLYAAAAVKGKIVVGGECAVSDNLDSVIHPPPSL